MPVVFSELSFGIELEFTCIQRSVAASVIGDFFHSRVERYGTRGNDTYAIHDSQSRTWIVAKDGSIKPQRRVNGRIVSASKDYQCELISPVLHYNDIPILQNLIRHLRRNGARTNDSTGIHVHVGAERFTANSLRILCNILFAKQPLLEKALLIEDCRRRYCQNLSYDFIVKLNRFKPKEIEEFADIWYSSFPSRNHTSSRYHDSRYRILNLHQLFSGRYQTVEYRMFNSTMHAGKVKSYIQLCLLITAQALNQKKASYQVTETDNDKYTFRTWLLRMGAVSDEFKTMRYHLLNDLNGNAAWRNPRNHERAENFSVSMT